MALGHKLSGAEGSKVILPKKKGNFASVEFLSMLEHLPWRALRTDLPQQGHSKWLLGRDTASLYHILAPGTELTAVYKHQNCFCCCCFSERSRVSKINKDLMSQSRPSLWLSSKKVLRSPLPPELSVLNILKDIFLGRCLVMLSFSNENCNPTRGNIIHCIGEIVVKKITL